MQLKPAGWIAVKRDIDINYDLENSPLEIKTNNKDRIRVRFHTASDNYAGAVSIFFDPTPKYALGGCIKSDRIFETDLPSGTDKIWKITLTRKSEVRLMLHCNDKEVLNVVISDTCDDDGWREKWIGDVDGNVDVEKINFPPYDKASEYYRPGK